MLLAPSAVYTWFPSTVAHIIDVPNESKGIWNRVAFRGWHFCTIAHKHLDMAGKSSHAVRRYVAKYLSCTVPMSLFLTIVKLLCPFSVSFHVGQSCCSPQTLTYASRQHFPITTSWPCNSTSLMIGKFHDLYRSSTSTLSKSSYGRFPRRISYNKQPMANISSIMEASSSVNGRNRQYLVSPDPVMLSPWIRENPKSHILRSLLSERRILRGEMSPWTMSFECKNLKADTVCRHHRSRSSRSGSTGRRDL